MGEAFEAGGLRIVLLRMCLGSIEVGKGLPENVLWIVLKVVMDVLVWIKVRG